MSKRNISAQDKINAVKRYLNGLTSQRILANEFSISQAIMAQLSRQKFDVFIMN